MKRPQPDLGVSLVNTFIAKMGANRKLKKLWGTTTVQGVEVLHARRHYHTAAQRPANWEKLFKYLKVYDDVKDYKGEGIKSAWFTLNKSNGPENLVVDNTYVTNNLNRMWWDTNDGPRPENLTLTTTITIAEDFKYDNSVSGIDFGAPKEVIAQYIIDNYDTLWDTKKIIQEGVGIINKGSVLDTEYNIEVPDEDDLSPDDPWLAIISRYALKTNGIPCTIKDVEVGLGTPPGVAYNTAVVTLEIPYFEFTTSTPLVQEVLGDTDTAVYPTFKGFITRSVNAGLASSNEHITQKSAKTINYYETTEDIDEDTVSRSYYQWEDSTTETSVYNNFWIKDGDQWYFRADVIDNPKAYGTTHTKLNSYLFSLLDTGYKKKKVPWWKKIIAAIIFIIAVIISWFYPPAAIAMKPVMVAAYAVLIGALVIALVTAVFSAIGWNEWAMAFAWVSKEIEPLVTVATIIMIIDIIGTSIELVKQEGLKALAKEIIVNVIGKDLVNLLSGAAMSNIAIVRLSTRVINIYTDTQVRKLERLSDKIEDVKAKNKALQDEVERESLVTQSWMNIYGKPATADWSIYAATYDLPYERTGGTLMGNIQITTKQAMRKADYEEAVFENIAFI